MQIKLNSRESPALEFKDGRYYYTFTAQEDSPTVDIYSNCLGDTQLKRIQIERNPDMTYWVQPEVYEGNLSGIFKDLKEINLEMTDTNSELWGKIKINARGMLEEYHKGTLSAEFMRTAGGIEKRLRDALTQSENRYSETAEGIKREIRNVDGRVNTVTETVDGFKREVTDSISGVRSSITQLNNGIEQRISNATSGEFSKLTQRVNGLQTTIGNVSGNYSTLSQTVSGLQTKVSGYNGLESQITQLAGQINQKVTRNDVTSIIGQSGDAIWLTIRDRVDGVAGNATMTGAQIKAAINLSTDGIAISGKQVSITGDTYIQNGVITSAKIADLDASKIKTGTLDAAQVNLINLNANKIVGLDANFIKSKIGLAIIDWMKGKTISAQNDAMKINLNSGQILYYTDQAAMKRILSGYPTQFVKFATGTVSGEGNAGVTVIGSNRNGTESSNDGGFVGIRAWNGSNIDQIDVVGDHVRLASSAYNSADGWDIITLPNRLEIDAYNANHRASSRVKVGDVWLWKNSSTYSSLRDTINSIIDNLNLLHNNKTTKRDYSYTMPAKV